MELRIVPEFSQPHARLRKLRDGGEIVSPFHIAGMARSQTFVEFRVCKPHLLGPIETPTSCYALFVDVRGLISVR